MARKQKPAPKEQKTATIAILPNSVFVCYEKEFTYLGIVVDVAPSEAGAHVAWDCRYVVVPERWQVREIINARVLLGLRGTCVGGLAGNESAVGGELVVTEVWNSALQVLRVPDEQGAPKTVIMEERPQRVITIYEPGTRANVIQFFSHPDWYASFHGLT